MNKIGVVGIGRLGLCFALNAEDVGYEVYGIDVDENLVKRLKAKQLITSEPSVSDYLKKSTRFFPTTSYEIIIHQDIKFIYIMVPTPSEIDGAFSHNYIDDCINKILALGIPKDKKHLVIGSTTMPGYCEKLAEKLVDFNYTVSYNPEFIAQGSIIHDQQYPDQILIGEGDTNTTAKLREIYSKICRSSPEFLVMDRTSAEITKLATNCFLTMKISFANAIGDLSTKMDANPDLVLNAIGSDSRIGKKYLKYGYGFGGPCFPRDNQALQFAAKKAEYPLMLSESTVQVNQLHLEFQFQKLMKKDLDVYYFESVTYKPSTDILEESQQLLLAVKLVEAGKRVMIKNNLHVQHILEEKYPNYFEFSDL
jgi:nucleotide sugar dehydrogenase